MKPSKPKAPKPPASLVARLLVWAGAATLSVGIGLVFVPAGVIAGGLALLALGLLVVDTGGKS